jgi:hypothetical protein
MPVAVRFVKTSKDANADAYAILKPMAGIGTLRSVCLSGAQSSRREGRRKPTKTTVMSWQVEWVGPCPMSESTT